jgi:ABC-type phosphate/phosphonate transport system substrate-binding protein
LPTTRLLTRLLALTALSVLALGLASCGGSDDDSDSGKSADEVAVTETVESLYDAMRASDPAGVCRVLDTQAQKQISAGALSSKKTKTCEEGFQGFFDAAEKAGGLNLTLKAKVRGVKVNGDKATVTVTFGGARAGKIPLSKVDGVWKLSAVGATPTTPKPAN